MARKAALTKTRNYAGSESGVVKDSMDMYNFPSNENIDEQDSTVVEARSRKRRRLTPKDDLSIASKIQDDDKQKNRARGKFRGVSKTTLCGAVEAIQDPEITAALGRNSLGVSDCEGSLTNESGALIPTNASSPSKILLSKPHQPHSSLAKQKPTAHLQKKHELPVRRPRRKGLEDEASLARPSRLPATPPRLDPPTKSPALGRDNTRRSQGFERSLPSTPSCLPKNAGMRTTPKQQQLWQRVLADNLGRTRLKHDEIGSHDTSREDHAQAEMIEISAKSHNQNTTTRSGKRSLKLTDCLMSSAQEDSSSEDDYGEDLGSSGAERSRSIRSDVSNNDEMLTTQTSPSIRYQSKRHQTQDHTLAPTSKSVPITYIRERTHLGEVDRPDTLMLDVPLVNRAGILGNDQWRDASETQYKSLSSNNANDDDGEVEDPQGSQMKSIHELREAGGNSRVAGELDAILDDLEDSIGSSIAIRRSSLLSLASKLLDASTCRMFVNHNLEPRFLAQLNFSYDIFERSLLAASILQIVFNTTSSEFLSQVNHTKTVNLLIGLLDQTHDLSSQGGGGVKLRESKMSRLAQTELITFYKSFLRLPLWRSSKPPIFSGQIVAVQCLNLLVLRIKEAACQSATLSFDALSHIAETSLPLQGPLQPQSPSSRFCLAPAVSILESSTSRDEALFADDAWTNSALERITGVFTLLSEDASLEDSSLSILTLRLYLNLTNTSPKMCEIFSRYDVVRSVCQNMFLQFDLLSGPENLRQDLHVLEKLVLSLGYMINLAESSDNMRLMMMDLEIEQQKPLETLLQLFLKRKTAAEVRGFPTARSHGSLIFLGVFGSGG